MTQSQKRIGIGLVAASVVVAATLLLTQTTTTVKHYPIKNLLGVNLHPWDLIASNGSYGPAAAKQTADKQNAITSTGFTWLRIYVDAYNVKDVNNTSYAFNPTINNGGGYMVDSAIFSLKKANQNLKVDYCYQNAPKNIQAEWQAIGKKSTQYRHPNTDPLNPASWSELAHDMAVITARGGSNVNAPAYPVYTSPNWWDPKQTGVRGSKLYDQVEDQNELDNNWGNDQFLNGSQYAVLWKTTYDSVKKVDSTMSVSTTGVMSGDPPILTDALNYAKSKGWGKIFDVYQFHCYPWGWGKNMASALPPEMNMIPQARKIVEAAGGLPCDIGEWSAGDLHPNSDMGIRPFGGHTASEISAWWTTRGILGFAAVGIHAAYHYRMYQDYGLANDSNSTIFETSSLFIKDNNDSITRRLSGDVFYMFATQYPDYYLDSVIVADSSKVVYKFTDGTKGFYVGWNIEQVSLITVPNGAYTTNRAQFTEVKSNYTLPNGQTVQLSSKPVFVAVGGTPPPPQPPPPPVKDTIWTYTGRKGYWIVGKRVYYKVYLIRPDSIYQIKTGGYNWYKQ
jgi:hypothetical protein